MTDAVEEVSKQVEQLSNTTTSVRSLDKLIKKYNELSRRTYLSAKEQEELNEVIQQMSDSLDIETITDEYGNLQISIESVKGEYEDLIKKQDEALQKMKEVEQEQLKKATSGLGNNYTEADFYSNLLKENSKDYQALLRGIQDGLNKDTRQIADSIYTTLNSNFKKSINKMVSDYTELYDKEGIAQSFVNLEDEINEKLQATDG